MKKDGSSSSSKGTAGKQTARNSNTSSSTADRKKGKESSLSADLDLIMKQDIAIEEETRLIREKSNCLKNIKTSISSIKDKRKKLEPGQDRQNGYLELKSKKQERNDIQNQVFYHKEELKQARKRKYDSLFGKVRRSSRY